MTDTPNHEWEHWQAAWRTQPSAPMIAVADLRRMLLRHRRAAWIYTALDIVASIALCWFALYGMIHRPTVPMLVWGASVLVFAAIGLSFAIWNRRDALFFSAQPTADFLPLLRVRHGRRERWLRFMVWFMAAQTVFVLVYTIVLFPSSLALMALLWAAILVPLTGWWWWYHKRLRRQRAQLDALCRDDGGAPDPTPPVPTG
jgi:hypothetical protein